MFLKKRPDLPKAPDLSKVQDFSLFGKAAKSVRGEDPSAGVLRPNKRISVPEEDIIDVEVVERAPTAQRSPLPVVEEVTPASAEAEGSAVPAAPHEPAPEHLAAPQRGKPFSGLKVVKKSSTGDAPAPSPESRTSAGLAESAASAEKPKGLFARVKAQASAKAASFAEPQGTPGPQAPEQPVLDQDDGGAPAAVNRFAAFAGKKARPEAAAADSKPKTSVFASLSAKLRSSAAAPAKAEQPTPADAPKAGLRGAEKRKKTSKPENAAKLARATPKGALDVMVELEDARRVFWRVTAQSLESLAPNDVRQAASFSKGEQRFAVEAGLAYSAAHDLALAEIGEEVRIVNASKALRAVFACTATRIQELQPVQTGPGLFLLESLLKNRRAEGEPAICALVLKGDEQAQSLAILYHFNEKDEASAPQITVNPDNLNFVLAQFAASRRLELSSTKVVLLSNADLLSVAGALQMYPSETVWRGVPLRKILWGAAAVAAAGAGFSVLYAGQGYVSQHAMQGKLHSAQAQKSQAQKEVDAVLVASVSSFARTQGLNLDEITERAGVLWTPGAKVAVDAAPATQVYSIALPLTRGGSLGNRPSVLYQMSLSNVEPLLNKEPPQGCTKAVPEVSGGMNVVQITVTCESAAGSLSAYRLD